MGKKWYLSKTIWANAITIASLIFYGQELGADTQLAVLGVVNTLLRLITKEPITWGKGGAAPSAGLFLLASSLYALTPNAAQAQEEYISFPEPNIVPVSVLTRVVQDDNGDFVAQVMPASMGGIALSWLESGETVEDDIVLLKASVNFGLGVVVGGNVTPTFLLLTQWFDDMIMIGATYDLGEFPGRSNFGVAFGASYSLD